MIDRGVGVSVGDTILVTPFVQVYCFDRDKP